MPSETRPDRFSMLQSCHGPSCRPQPGAKLQLLPWNFLIRAALCSRSAALFLARSRASFLSLLHACAGYSDVKLLVWKEALGQATCRPSSRLDALTSLRRFTVSRTLLETACFASVQKSRLVSFNGGNRGWALQRFRPAQAWL